MVGIPHGNDLRSRAITQDFSAWTRPYRGALRVAFETAALRFGLIRYGCTLPGGVPSSFCRGPRVSRGLDLKDVLDDFTCYHSFSDFCFPVRLNRRDDDALLRLRLRLRVRLRLRLRLQVR